MTDTTGSAILLVLMLVLPISALAARRLPVGETVKLALIWLAIFGVLFGAVALWQGAMGVGASVRGIFQ